ncbi:K(+)/H(+) antiporter [Podochytrium sp. JEL0797]|nr:K(+)/H(+) antiporter [Podochytrium sp. JEL0797]
MAEILGGLVLGASCLSRIPAFKDALFPAESLLLLKLVADLGLIFYLFLVGLELDPVSLMKTFKKSASISMAGIALPFVLGAGASKVIYNNFADPNVPFTSFMLFSGIAMSITAFPVLARILTERKMLHTPVGESAIAAAAVDDFMAWTLLVLVVALINNSGGSSGGSYVTAVYVFLCVVAYTIFLWFIIRPLLSRLVHMAADREHLNQLLYFVVFTAVLFSSWFTEVIGVQAIFGAFLVGVIMPHDHGFAHKVASKIEDLVIVVFLPLYFAYSGLNTNLDLLDDGKSWLFVLLIVLVACVGKLVGCSTSARVSGLNWRESFAVGILMNTRGLVQIIVLNVGLSAGVITSKLFAMYVVMAIFTTFMTVPLISIVYPASYYNGVGKDSDVTERDPSVKDIDAPAINDPNLRALVCLPNMATVSPMLSVCTMISTSGALSSFSVFGLRLAKIDSRFTTLMQAAELENTIKEDSILSVFRTFSSLHGVSFTPLLEFTESSHVAESIVVAAKQSLVNMVIIPQAEAKNAESPSTPTGRRISSFQNSWIGDSTTHHTRQIARNVSAALPNASVIHFMDRGFMSLTTPCDQTPPTSTTTMSSKQISSASFSQPDITVLDLTNPRSSKSKQNLSRLNTSFIVPSPVTIILLVTGQSEPSQDEAIRLMQHISGFANGTTTVPFELHVIQLLDISVTPPLTAPVVSILNAQTITMSLHDTAAVTLRLSELCRKKEDLVVVPESVFRSSAYANGDPALEHWLDYAALGSVAVVYATGVGGGTGARRSA